MTILADTDSSRTTRRRNRGLRFVNNQESSCFYMKQKINVLHVKQGYNKGMNNSTNIAFIGLGRWAKVLFPAFDEVANITKVYSKGNEKNSKWLFENYPTVEATEELDGILKDKNVDAVVIVSPLNTHYDIAKNVLLNEKHVFIEKPIAVDVEAVKVLHRLAKEKDKCLFVGYTFLYSEILEKLKEIVSTEEVFSVELSWEKWGTFNENIFWNLFIHELSILVTLLGGDTNNIEIGSVKAESIKTDSDIIDVVLSINNVPCTLHINRVKELKNKRIKITTRDVVYIWNNDQLLKQDTNGRNKVKI